MAPTPNILQWLSKKVKNSPGLRIAARIASYYLLPKALRIIVSLRLVASQFPPWLSSKYTSNFDDLTQPRRENVSYQAIIEYFQNLAHLYFNADKNKKTQLLDDAVKITGRHRKSIIRHMGRRHPSRGVSKVKRGPKAVYPKDILLPHVEFLWKSMERISARRMKSALKDWLPFYHQNGIDNRTKYLLQKMSVSTLDRFLAELRIRYRNNPKGISTTSPATYMKNKVPINSLDSTVTRPGHIQVDTVAHCGESASGPFISSLTFTDIYSTWTENRALFTKNSKEVAPCLDRLQRDVPFDIFAVNTDSGSEFLNMRVFNRFKKRGIHFTRSRPYRKNDNCYVEQKNYTHVRELFGYQRFEEEELRDLMNDIYKNCWSPLLNYFIPSFKIKKKIRIGAKVRKIYGPPVTPYQRLMDSPSVSEEQKVAIGEIKKGLNPFELKRELEEKLSSFFARVNEYNKGKDE